MKDDAGRLLLQDDIGLAVLQKYDLVGSVDWLRRYCRVTITAGDRAIDDSAVKPATVNRIET